MEDKLWRARDSVAAEGAEVQATVAELQVEGMAGGPVAHSEKGLRPQRWGRWMDSVSFCRATFLGMKSAEVRACARMRWDRQAQRLPVAMMVKGALKEGPCRVWAGRHTPGSRFPVS